MDVSKIFADVKSSINPYIDLARPYNAVAALLAFCVGFFYFQSQVNLRSFWIGFAVVLLLHSAFTIQNDLQDLDVDTANKRVTPLTEGKVTASSVRQVVFNTIIFSLFISLFSTNRIYCLVFILAYCGLGWLYDNRPFQASRRPIISVIILGLLYSLLPLGFGLALSGNSSTTTFAQLVITLTVIRMSISILKDFKDVSGDKKHHKRTFYLVFGRKPTVYLSLGLALICYPLASLLILRTSSKLPFIATGLLVVASLANLINRFILLTTESEKHLSQIFRKSFLKEHYFEGAILLCLLVS